MLVSTDAPALWAYGLPAVRTGPTRGSIGPWPGSLWGTEVCPVFLPEDAWLGSSLPSSGGTLSPHHASAQTWRPWTQMPHLGQAGPPYFLEPPGKANWMSLQEREG